MSDEIEEFLRRAAQLRRQRTQAAQRPRPQKPSTAAPQQPAIMAEIIEETTAESPAQTLAERTRLVPQVGGQIAARGVELGSAVSQADEKMDSHLKEVFDHEVGTLKSSRTPVTPKVRELHPIVALLRNRKSLRQAVILSEIMTPAFRRHAR